MRSAGVLRIQDPVTPMERGAGFGVALVSWVGWLVVTNHSAPEIFRYSHRIPTELRLDGS